MLGIYTGAKKIFPFWHIRTIYEVKIKGNNLKNFNICNINEINQLPPKFSVIVGHAYGSPNNSSLQGAIAENIAGFLLKNQKSISSVIFTGDVFAAPSSAKWDNLFKQYKANTIYISPGNHDILSPSSKEIFIKNKSIRQPFPYNIEIENFFIMIDDSISSNWKVSPDLVEKINIYNSDLIVARHNIPIAELSHLANSTAGATILPSVEEFVNKFSDDKKITWVMGDGGAFAHLPRLSCYEIKNHRFIINGIGQAERDTIIILHEGKISKYIIGK